MRILHKEGHNVELWLYDDDGLPLGSIVVQSDTQTAIEAALQADLASAWVTECPICYKVSRCFHDLENTPSR